MEVWGPFNGKVTTTIRPGWLSSPLRSIGPIQFSRVSPRRGVLTHVKDNLSDNELREKLQSWRVDPHIPDDFQGEVWKRITAQQSGRVDPIWLTWIQRFLSFGAAPSMPRIAFAAVTLSVFVGVAASVAESTRWNAAAWKQLENQYVQSIDPYQRAASL